MSTVSPQKAREIVDALRRGTVPQRGLDAFAVGLERYVEALDADLAAVKSGAAQFKAVRGEYGSGKTFFSRWLVDRAHRAGFATTEVQISETETPLHRLQTVYRRMIERLATSDMAGGALRSIVDGWFFTLDEDVLSTREVSADDARGLFDRTSVLMEQRLLDITRVAPSFAAVLRGYRQAQMEQRLDVAEGLLAWLGAQPHVAADIKRYAGLKGDIDHDGALNFIQGLLTVLRDSGHVGLLVVLDEVETLQRVRTDVRDKGLNALRQLMDEVDGGRFPGLFLVITGTPPFFDGPNGVQRLAPLAQRLHVDFATHERFDNPRAAQIRLAGFDLDKLCEVGRRVRTLFCAHANAPDRVRRLADDAYLAALARAVTGNLGGKVGISPRVFLKKLVADVLDRIDQFEDFDPRQHYKLTIDEVELTAVERNARAAPAPDDIELDL